MLLKTPRITKKEISDLGLSETQTRSILALIREKTQSHALKLAGLCLEYAEEAKNQAEEAKNQAKEARNQTETATDAKWQARSRLQRISILEGKVDLREKLSIVESELRGAYGLGRGTPRLEVWSRAFSEYTALMQCVRERNGNLRTPRAAAENMQRLIGNVNAFFHPTTGSDQARSDVTLIIESEALPKSDCLFLDCVLETFNMEREVRWLADLEDSPRAARP